MHRKILCRLLAAVLFWAATGNLSAQGTAIFYQGRLNVGGLPASTNFDFRFTVYDAVTNGYSASISLTNAAVPVANGLFSVKLDFGSGVFSSTDNGSNYWLDIGVRAVGGTNFTVLSPRQPILPVPYAIFATSASNLLGGLPSSQLVGTLPSALLAGTYSGSVSFPNAANSFFGTFSGNGASLNSLNGSAITSGTVADARLTANVALLNANQTFTGTNKFTGTNFFNGANTFTNWGNSFVGSFFGNGLVGWLPVYGTATNATIDHGYLLLNSGLTTVTLPTTPLSVGDIVRVSGAGAGGWLVQENSGQSIIGSFASYANCYVVTFMTAGRYNYNGFAASADGVRMYAVGGDTTGIYASADSGRTWSAAGSFSGSWKSVACSANGEIVYAIPAGSGAIERSTDGGVNWTAISASANWGSISCSADGSKYFTGNVACSGDGTFLAKLSGGAITVSTNGGLSFDVNVTSPGVVSCLAASSDCTRLVVGGNPGLLWATSNRGAKWTALTATNQYWSSAWMSADGSRLAGAVATVGVNGGLFYSSTSPQPNTISTNSSIGGSRGSAVELQFIGSGLFIPVSSSGLLWSN